MRKWSKQNKKRPYAVSVSNRLHIGSELNASTDEKKQIIKANRRWTIRQTIQMIVRGRVCARLVRMKCRRDIR